MSKTESGECSGTMVWIAGCGFYASGCELVAANGATGEERFRRRLDHPEFAQLRGLAIRQLCVAPDGNGVIVLLEQAPRGYRTVGNLVRVGLDGAIAWWAELPSHGTDDYYSVRIAHGELWAYSTDGYDQHIDERSGKVLEQVWVK